MNAWPRRQAIIGIASLAALSMGLGLWRHFAAPAARSAEPIAESRALALGWDGFATTTLDAAPLDGDHTLSFRFMAAYDASYRGVIIADEGGSYHLGMAPNSSLGRPALELCVGGATLTYPLPDAVLTDNDFRAGPPRQPTRRWRHVALSRRGAAVVVAYDGHIVGSLQAGAEVATGKLRLGRLARPIGGQDQFYGLIDDIGWWSHALDDAELTRLTAVDQGAAGDFAPPQARLDFDAGRSAARSASFTLGGTARLAPVSRDRRADLDEPRLPGPTHQTRLELPFLPEQVWMPIQGVNSALSHHDIAAFALDFIRVDPSFVTDNPRHVPGGSHDASQGQPVVAVASGRVTARSDAHAHDELSRAGGMASNFVCVQHRPRETSCALHLLPGGEAREAGRVTSGEMLGRVGSTGAATVHLHFALSDLPEATTPDADSKLVTIPAAFSDYFASSDFGRSWRHVVRGTPATGEWVRRARTSQP